MENEVELPVFKGKAFCHIAADDPDVIAFALCHEVLIFDLQRGIIKHRADSTERRKDRHLLPAPAGKSQDLLSFQISQPFMRDRFGGRQQDFPFTALCFFKILMGNGLSPLPSFPDPPVDRLCIDVLVRFLFAGQICFKTIQHLEHVFRKTLAAFLFHFLRNPVKCFRHAARDAGQRVTVAAQRNRGPDHIFKVRSFQESGDRFRHRFLAAFHMMILRPDLVAGPGKIVSEFPDDILPDLLL